MNFYEQCRVEKLQTFVRQSSRKHTFYMSSCICLRWCTKMDFLTVAYLRYLNSVGMNLNWVRINWERKRTNIFSIWQEPLNSITIFWMRHHILEGYYFLTRKHIEVDLIFLLRRDQKCIVYVYVFWILPVFFCWQDTDMWQTDKFFVL